ncbi:hypothetical protein VTK73DRAFT_9507 [Phialemonium thermophilum]|uniref:C2H2-type domain-containing protein n=1 Tax=Phialemonium thermophilum TaxID=223376 RepID=A0ABR3Y5B4_9PEZI
MDSSDGYEEDATEPADDLPPAKRQKIGDGSVASSAVVPEPEHDPDPLDGMSDVSSDTSGDVPSSPINARLDEEDFQEQVTVCAWEGCKAGDLKNMDRLVEHIHNDHIEGRQKKYTCEWTGCPRKSMPHASGYALKAHMRSHTREKPFYCYLPECDRAFTRSDALAKHMRTVHETEALRPSDPIPKSLQPTGKSSKLKIIIKTPQSQVAGHDDLADDGMNSDDSGSNIFTALTQDQGFTSKELAMPLERLHTLCRCQARWAERESEDLRRQCKKWEELYNREWLEKEVLLDQVVQTEMDWHKRRRAVLSGEADVQIPDPVTNGTSHMEDGDTAGLSTKTGEKVEVA